MQADFPEVRSNCAVKFFQAHAPGCELLCLVITVLSSVRGNGAVEIRHDDELAFAKLAHAVHLAEEALLGPAKCSG